MNAFTIKDIENLTGIKAHTIRIWEQRYSFLRPQRTGTNIRYYSNDELKAILNIALLNKHGFKISHIDKMQPAEITENIFGLNHTEAKQERILNELIHYMVDIDIEQFEKLLDEYIAIKGVDKAINEIIFPFLNKIGILWQTNHINPAQEHLVSNIIRQKLIVGIETATPPYKLETTALLFLPEGEFHEVGLLYVSFLLKSNGVKCLYLGANVPLKDLHYIIQLKKPDYIHTHLTSVAHNFNLEKYLTKLNLRLNNLPVMISGPLTQSPGKSVPSNVILKDSLADVVDYISSLK
jgi:DNA-binding transcriptional MerR regulator